MSIGNVLKKLREKKGYNKVEVAKQLKMPYTTYNNYETGARDVGSETLRKFASFYGVSIDFLLENEPSTQEYYIDPEAAAYAQKIYEDPDLRVLFDASRKVSKDDLKAITEMVKRMKGVDED